MSCQGPGKLPPPFRREDADHFFARLAAAVERLLFLDYDGTLAPFKVDRDRAHPYPGVREALETIQADGGTRLVIVSGRPVAEIRKLLALQAQPELWGSHGWERIGTTGSASSLDLPREVVAQLDAAWTLLCQHDLTDQGERKPASVAVHWRGLAVDDVQAIRHRIQPSWQKLARSDNLDLQAFDGGLELRARGRDKGFAVRTVLAEAKADAVAAYLGDDRTDEDAFRALRPRDLALLVRPQRRVTEARFWLEPPEELLGFLQRWSEAARQ